MRTARADELAVVEDLLTAASEWLASRGSDQWQFPPHRDRIVRSIDRGECFLAVRDGAVVGTIAVDDLADAEFWTAEDKPDHALYIHRMAVSRQAAGQGVGAAMLEWAARHAVEAGKTMLRLDAWKDNFGLHRYYQDQGFRHLRTIDLQHRGSGALFEREL
jgi:GNAT superfamily N-acetyltransferase